MHYTGTHLSIHTSDEGITVWIGEYHCHTPGCWIAPAAAVVAALAGGFSAWAWLDAPELGILAGLAAGCTAWAAGEAAAFERRIRRIRGKM